jgi:hypothetical protein
VQIHVPFSAPHYSGRPNVSCLTTASWVVRGSTARHEGPATFTQLLNMASPCGVPPLQK